MQENFRVTWRKSAWSISVSSNLFKHAHKYKMSRHSLPRSYARSYSSLWLVLYNLNFLFDGSSPRTSVTAGSSTRGLALAIEAVGISKLNGPEYGHRQRAWIFHKCVKIEPTGIFGCRRHFNFDYTFRADDNSNSIIPLAFLCFLS